MEQTNYLEDMKHIDRKLVIISAIILITQNILRVIVKFLKQKKL